jgi:hypothetical protein
VQLDLPRAVNWRSVAVLAALLLAVAWIVAHYAESTVPSTEIGRPDHPGVRERFGLRERGDQGGGALEALKRAWDVIWADTAERHGYIPARQISLPVPLGDAEPPPIPQEPPNPQLWQPAMHNPGGVNGGRPPRPVPGIGEN